MTTDLTRFDKLTVEMDEFEKANANLVFDIESNQGEKDARSHVHKLRKIKTAIAAVHKEAKADILQAGRMLDAKKNELTGRVESWIELQDKPLREKKEREVHAAFLKTEEIRIAKEKEEADRLEAVRIREEEVTAKEETLRKAEQEQKDKKLAALEAKEAEFAAKEKELADKQAALDAEAEAQKRVKVATENAAMLAERDKEIAAQKAEREKNEAIDAERATVQAEKEKEEKEQAAWAAHEAERVADEEHRDKIQSESIDSLTGITGDIDLASVIVKAIDENEIPNIKIIY